MVRSITLGLGVLAGAAVLEAALVPGIVIGGAAVLAPGLVRRARRALFPAKPAGEAGTSRWTTLPAFLPKTLRVKQSVAKTITFRVVATAIDFTANYMVLGDPTVAAGLSGIGLVVGPVFYFVHETAWNYYRGPSSVTIDVPALSRLGQDNPPGAGEFRVSRAVAKTITFRTVVTVMDFTANILVIGDLATAVGLTAVGFVLGPIVYLGHEKVWERFGSQSVEEPNGEPAAGTAPALLAG